VRDLDRIETKCAALDALTDGGLSTGTITQIFGEKALGKSLLSFQAAYSAACQGNSALIVDTEQSYFSYLLKEGGWDKRLAKRFGKEVPVRELKLERNPKGSKRARQVSRSQLVTALSGALNQLGVAYTDVHLGMAADVFSPEFRFDVEDSSPSVMIAQIPEVVPLLAVHGIDARREVSEGGRVEMRLNSAPVYNSALQQVVETTGTKLIVYDSISAPLKATFPATQDLPARSATIAMMLSHAQKLCVDYGIAIVVTSHVSIDPMHGWNRKPYGGVMLGHDAKFVFELAKSDSKRDGAGEEVNPDARTEDGRSIWVQRHPAMAEYSRKGYAVIDEGGFH
jgi:RecA/RadA recombinase